MKRSLITLLFLFPAWVFCQDPIPMDHIGSSFDLFARVIEERFQVKIFYKQEWVSEFTGKIDIEGETIENVLDHVLNNTGLGYLKYSDKNYVIAPAKDLSAVLSLNYVLVKERFNKAVISPDLPVLTVGDSSKMGLSGESALRIRLLDFKNDAPLSGAVMYIEDLNLNAVSSPEGVFDITVPSGLHLTEIRRVGYRPFIGYLSVMSDGAVDIFLDEEIIELDEVIVTGEGAQKNIRSASAGVVSITPRQIKELPVFLGEADLIKSLLTQPGVSTLGEGTSGYFVRGGNIDQNLILQDGSLFFNSSHALGFFSVFNPDIINSVTLYKGHIPAQYGGRLSSVLQVDLNGSVSEKFKVSGGIGTVMSKISAEVPIPDSKSSLLLGARTTYSNYLLKMVKNPDVRSSAASFYDFNMRYNLKVGDVGSAYLSFYRSGDRVQYERAFGFNWDISNLAMGLNQTINQFLFSETSFSTGKTLNETFDPSEISSYLVQGGQRYMKAKQNLIAATEDHEVQAGVEWTNFKPEDEVLVGTTDKEQVRISRNGGHEFGVFVNDDWEVSEVISVSAGLRWSAFLVKDSLKGDDTFFKNFEPRLSLRVAIGATSSLKASFNRINQYLHLVTNTSSALPNDQWLAASNQLLPKSANNYSLGFFKNFEFNQWESSLEVFYRDLQNMAETKSFANLVLNPSIEDDLVQGDGQSYGVEVYVKRNTGRLKGSLSYTYSRSLLYISLESDEKPKWISSAFDRPHNLNLNLDYTFSKKSRFALNFVFISGRPVTAPTSTYLLGKVVVPHYSERNQFNIPNYHRLDVAYTVKRNAIKRRRYQDSITFSIYNVYGRRNAFSVFFRKDRKSAASAYRLSILGSAFPSITYNFQF